MSEADLRVLIEKLRREIDALPESDVDARTRLAGILEELDGSLASAGESKSEDPSGITGSIQQAVQDLETRHPDATTVLNNIMMTLANMGI